MKNLNKFDLKAHLDAGLTEATSMKYDDRNFLKMLAKNKVVNDNIGKQIKLALLDMNNTVESKRVTKLLD